MDDASTREIYEAERPQDAIADYKAENARLTARIAELEKALKDAQQTMRNAWGAVTTNQIADKGVAEMLKDGVRHARTTLEASERGGGE